MSEATIKTVSEAISEPINYFYVLHGVPLDFFPAVAYRKAKGFTAIRQKTIKCPYCGKLLTTIDVTIKVELYRHPRRKDISCHEYRQCNSCRETVGFIFETV